jgi:hypothetical protein
MKDTHHTVMLSCPIYYCYADCFIAVPSDIMLSNVIPSIVMPSDIILSVIMLNIIMGGIL